MKELIKKILKEETSIKHRLQSMIKTIGWGQTAQLVGSDEKLAEMAFDNDPMEFLDLFKGLTRHTSKTRFDIFKDEKNNRVALYNRFNNRFLFGYNEMWEPLEMGFYLNPTEIRKIGSKWVEETFGIENVIVDEFDNSITYYDF
jgi:hypothetical protein